MTDEELARTLHERFGYTRDNNRDLLDGTCDHPSTQTEIDVLHAYLTLVNYLIYLGRDS